MNKIMKLFDMEFKSHMGQAGILRVNWNTYFSLCRISKEDIIPKALWSVDIGGPHSSDQEIVGIHIHTHRTARSAVVPRSKIKRAKPTVLEIGGMEVKMIITDELPPDSMYMVSPDGKSLRIKGLTI